MQTLKLETARLTLRPFRSDDFEVFYQTCVCDPSVMDFYHAYRALHSDAERRARSRRDFLEHFERGALEYGYICWALTAGPSFQSQANSFIGWCGVVTPALDHSCWGPELAYMLARPWQGLGLATEAGEAVLADAWRRYNLPRLHAVVDAPNISSRRVLERLAFDLHGPVEIYGSANMVLYTAKPCAA